MLTSKNAEPPAAIAQQRLPLERRANDDELLSTGDMARLSGNTLRTVRFYEEAGLLEPVGRSNGHHRLFAPSQLQRLKLISELREAGLSLREIRAVFEIREQAEHAPDASEAMATLLEEHITLLHEKIQTLRSLRDELAAMRSAIDECRGCSDGRFPGGCGDCEVVNNEKAPRALRLLWSK